MKDVKIACVGSRKTPLHILDQMQIIGQVIAKKWFICASGNAEWADQAFQMGANSVSPRQVTLYLPDDEIIYNVDAIEEWNTVEVTTSDDIIQAESILRKSIPYFEKLNKRIREVHTRNYKIIKDSQCVIYWNKPDRNYGGVFVDIKIASTLGIPVYNLFFPDTFEKVIDLLNSDHIYTDVKWLKS